MKLLSRWFRHASASPSWIEPAALATKARSMHSRTCPPFRRQGGDEFCQPRDCTWCATPSRAAFRDVVGRLVRPTHGDVAIVRGHRRLRAGQDGGYMLVRGPGIPDQCRAPLVVAPALAKSHERPGIEPERASVLVRGQQLLERAAIVLSEQAPGKDVPYPLIVVRVQLEHVAVVGEGAGDVAKLHEGARETGPGPHIRACFEKAPEVAGIFLEAPWSERQFPGLDTLRIVVSSLLDRSGCFFGQKDISISAKRRDAECFMGERYPGTGGGSLPGLVHHVLRFRRRIVTAASGDRRQEALHRAPVRQHRGGAGLRRGFRGCFRAPLLRDWHPLLLVPDFRIALSLMGCPSDAGRQSVTRSAG